ncbi:HEPN domain-containing protein [Sphingobacterium sp. CZ-2]|uniref:HEPN domain-containing protein n=1 Tax=Sphingobacterium sp. CZ-2 TaxID=2557994 RepID=UPI00106F964F|nr:HEPN domain-containing protein [Sphingobacterium sp. CZ-2]QBR13554.1 HEPN domain-containing protein [Sphingobacterium sp. CZ-2]
MEKLAHLPLDKREKILEILEIIKDVALPEKVILFGSFARGDWVDDEYQEGGATYSYRSDFDFLVVLNNELKEKEYEIVSKIENRTLGFDHDVSPIVHTIEYINKGLSSGQYFFKDIIKEGIVLYDSNNIVFSSLEIISPENEYQLIKQYYENWIISGSEFLEGTKILFKNALDKKSSLNQVIFNLNQSVEKFYGGILLIYTGYKPKTHKIKIYRKYSKHISQELNQVFNFPIGDSEEVRLFDILNKSYIDSRYQEGYFIDVVDLKKLIEKGERLEKVVIKLSKVKLTR